MDSSCPGNSATSIPTAARIARSLARDADEQAANLGQWNQSYEQISPGSFRGCVHEAWLDGVQLFREQTDQILQEEGMPWPDSFTVGVPIVLRGSGCWCGEPLVRDTLIVLEPGAEMDFRTPRCLDIAAAVVDRHRLETHALRVGLPVPDAGAGSHRRALVRGAVDAARLRSFVVETFEALDASPEVLRHSAAVEALTEATLDRMLELLAPGIATTAPRTGLASHALVRRARDCILARLAEPPTVADLCAALGVSRRTLQYAFSSVLGVSPAAFLKAVRLNAVRRSLKEARPGKGVVQDVAAAWGFWHMGHFSRDYRRMFGELPSGTLFAGTANACAAP